MAKFLKTQLVDAETAYLVCDPDGDMDIVLPGEAISVGSKVKAGYLLAETHPTPDGVMQRWVEKDASLATHIPLQHNADLPTSAPSISSDMVERAIVHTETLTLGDKTTVVRATLWNGFEIVESSSCVSPENYRQSIGEAICMGKIRDKVWMLLGFLLQTAVSNEKVDV